MSERIRELVDAPVSFMQEGTHFLNKCTKPDRRGALAYKHAFLSVRVYPDLPCGRDGLCDYGLYWLPCEACAHPYQQHRAYLLLSCNND